MWLQLTKNGESVGDLPVAANPILGVKVVDGRAGHADRPLRGGETGIIAGIVVNDVPVREITIALVDVAFRPDCPDEFGEKRFAIHVLGRRGSYTTRGVP
jgi:hypothetical protein